MEIDSKKKQQKKCADSYYGTVLGTQITLFCNCAYLLLRWLCDTARRLLGGSALRGGDQHQLLPGDRTLVPAQHRLSHPVRSLVHLHRTNTAKTVGRTSRTFPTISIRCGHQRILSSWILDNAVLGSSPMIMFVQLTNLSALVTRPDWNQRRLKGSTLLYLVC